MRRGGVGMEQKDDIGGGKTVGGVGEEASNSTSNELTVLQVSV